MAEKEFGPLHRDAHIEFVKNLDKKSASTPATPTSSSSSHRSGRRHLRILEHGTSQAERRLLGRHQVGRRREKGLSRFFFHSNFSAVSI